MNTEEDLLMLVMSTLKTWDGYETLKEYSKSSPKYHTSSMFFVYKSNVKCMVGFTRKIMMDLIVQTLVLPTRKVVNIMYFIWVRVVTFGP